jgi:hypothetical protein
MSTTQTLRRGLPALALLIATLALFSAPSAHAKPYCPPDSTAPICNPGERPPPGGGTTPTPTPTPTPPPAPSVFTASRTDSVGAGQFMSTTTTVDRLNETMNSTVRTWTTIWFWGFHGCVAFDLLDGAGNVITHSQRPCFGVDGTAVGRSDRTDTIQWHLHSNEAANIRSVRIIHSLL